VTGAALLVLGAVALFAAIVGGGIKYRDIEVGKLPSLWRQGLLGVFGVFILLIGLGLMMDEKGALADPEPNDAANGMDPGANAAGGLDRNAMAAGADNATVVDANAAGAAGDGTMAPREHALDIYVQNDCREQVEFWLAYKNNDRWLTDGSWKFDPSKGGTLQATDGSAVAATSDEIYLYAKTPSGIGWTGNTSVGDLKNLTKANVGLDAQGRYTISMSCS
jgi:uncharacterized membrane protein